MLLWITRTSRVMTKQGVTCAKAIALSGAYSDVINALWIPDQVRDATFVWFVFLVILRLPPSSFSGLTGESMVKRRMDPSG